MTQANAANIDEMNKKDMTGKICIAWISGVGGPVCVVKIGCIARQAGSERFAGVCGLDCLNIVIPSGEASRSLYISGIEVRRLMIEFHEDKSTTQ